MKEEVKLRAGGYKHNAVLTYSDKIISLKFGYNKSLLEEVKSFDGARWNPETKTWSVKNNARNRFNLEYLKGGNPYARYDIPLPTIETSRPLYEHQKYLTATGLAYHYVIWAAEMGTGKTLSAIELMEKVYEKLRKANISIGEVWYIAPRATLRAIELELWKWKCKVQPKLWTYENLVKVMKSWMPGVKAPQMIFFDESSKIKNPQAQRSQAAYTLAEGIRQDWGNEGYVVLMSGSPAPKAPTDWWWQCEVACPGFLKEGTFEKFKNRLAIIEYKENLITGGTYPELKAWRDSEDKCDVCGKSSNDVTHQPDAALFGNNVYHQFKPSVNEVANLYRRMKGLVHVKFKRDCLDLPEKVYKVVELEPSKDVLRAAKLITKTTKSAAKALILLRELSDGFQYVENKLDNEFVTCPICMGTKMMLSYTEEDIEYIEGMSLDGTLPDLHKAPIDTKTITCTKCRGTGQVNKVVRETKMVPCPKEDLFIDLLEEHEDYQRFVTYAGFTGSIDRLVGVSWRCGWSTVRVDGRGWDCRDDKGNPVPMANPLEYFQDKKKYDKKLVFIGHPGSAGMGLTLTASPSIFFYSNDFNAESRIQAEDRIHRPGSIGANIIDCVHLPTDKKILDNLKKKRDLQSMSLGELANELENI